jgi:ABC-type bacteriocin/lantibiotic exporter with double-glycine peptidase domain
MKLKSFYIMNVSLGKSTLLKMLLRIYDPEEGAIFVDGKDIKTLRMADLRRAIATLFQSFTAFPLSVRIPTALRHHLSYLFSDCRRYWNG